MEQFITAENTVKSILSGFMQYKKASLKQSSYSTYSRILERHICPQFQDRKLSELDISELNCFLTDKLVSSGLSPSTVNGIACVLCELLRYAAMQGIAVPDVRLIIRPRQKQSSIEIFTESEVFRLKTYCASHLNRETLAILISLYTGMRLGEVCALRWSDISDDMIHVCRTAQRIKNTANISAAYNGNSRSDQPIPKTILIVDTPKSASSIRSIPITPTLAKYLKILHPASDCYILSDLPNRPADPRIFQNHYKQILLNAGVQPKNFHVLRHTFATTCSNLNFDPKSLSEILGHSDVSITFNTYVHPSMEIKRRLMQQLK